MLTLLKSQAFSIHSLLYGKVKKCTRLHFYSGNDHYFDPNSKKIQKLPNAPSWKISIKHFSTFFVLLGSEKPLFNRLSDHSTNFLTLISNVIKFFKNSLSLLYFLLTLYSSFAQLVSKVEQICLLKIFLYSTLRISVFTHTLGKIHFLLCFACWRFLCRGGPALSPFVQIFAQNNFKFRNTKCFWQIIRNIAICPNFCWR